MLCLRVIRALSHVSAPPCKRAPRLSTLTTLQKRFVAPAAPQPPFPPAANSPSPLVSSSLTTQYPPCRPRMPPCPDRLASASPPVDHLPRISLHPSMSSVQVRNAPRNTFNPSHRVRKRRHGFLSRLRTRTGRNLLKRRMLKRRSTLSH